MEIKLFVASPGDVSEERRVLGDLVDELTYACAAIAPEKQITLKLLRWETDAHPGMGRPQQVINDQLFDYDIFIGIMWCRFGTATASFGSGTEEEFTRAYEAWKERRVSQVLFYFCQEPSSPPKTKAEIEQLAKVIEFREKLSQVALVWEYPKHESFAAIARRHLVKVLGELIASADQPSSARSVGTSPRAPATSSTRAAVQALADQYVAVRASMAPSDERTRKMEAVVTEMRSQAAAGHTLLAEMVASDSPGMRLFAVAALEVLPNPEYLDWLAGRMGEEKPFVAYHAAVALRVAVRHLDSAHRELVSAALAKALQIADSVSPDRGRTEVLKKAAAELQGT